MADQRYFQVLFLDVSFDRLMERISGAMAPHPLNFSKSQSYIIFLSLMSPSLRLANTHLTLLTNVCTSDFLNPMSSMVYRFSTEMARPRARSRRNQ